MRFGELDTDDAWIRERTESANATSPRKAWRIRSGYRCGTAAPKMQNVAASEIDLIVVAASLRTYVPPTACLVQNNSGATNAWDSIFPRPVPDFFMPSRSAPIRGAGTQKKRWHRRDV